MSQRRNDSPASIKDLPAEIFLQAMDKTGIPHLETTRAMAALSNTGNHYHTLFKMTLAERKQAALNELLEAIIDQDELAIKKILDVTPKLVLVKPLEGSWIESKKTWQRFFAEHPLVMAVKLKNPALVTLLLSYYDKLEQTDELEQMKADSFKFITRDNKLKTKILLAKYKQFIDLLIDIFKRETFPYERTLLLSEDTEEGIMGLRHLLFPEKPIYLDNNIDVTVLLFAAQSKVWERYYELNHEQRIAFDIRVTGMINTTQGLEMAKKICEGIFNVFRLNYFIKDRAKSLRLTTAEPYYHPQRYPYSGQGIDYVCGWGGDREDFNTPNGTRIIDTLAALNIPGEDFPLQESWEKSLNERDEFFDQLKAAVSPAPTYKRT